MNLEDDLRRAYAARSAFPADSLQPLLSRTRVVPFRRRLVIPAIAMALTLAALVPPATVYRYQRQQRGHRGKRSVGRGVVDHPIAVAACQRKSSCRTRGTRYENGIYSDGRSYPGVGSAEFRFQVALATSSGPMPSGKTNITLEGDTLKLATSFLGGDGGPFKNLTGVYVRSFEFAKLGQYNGGGSHASPGLPQNSPVEQKSSIRKRPMSPAKSTFNRCRATNSGLCDSRIRRTQRGDCRLHIGRAEYERCRKAERQSGDSPTFNSIATMRNPTTRKRTKEEQCHACCPF